MPQSVTGYDTRALETFQAGRLTLEYFIWEYWIRQVDIGFSGNIGFFQSLH